MAFFQYDNKNFFYEIIGEGEPLVLLHGNTASSKMFDYEIDTYSKYFKVIKVDFIGGGQSERVVKFPVNYWEYNAKMVVELCNYLNFKNVNLLGTSGGAVVAFYIAIYSPNLINKIVADSFGGNTYTKEEAINAVNSRDYNNQELVGFWTWMHGDDWQNIVELDSQLLIDFTESKNTIFDKESLSKINSKILVTASKQDSEFTNIEIRLNDFIKNIKQCELVLFEQGDHPAMYSNQSKFRKLSIDFLLDNPMK